jgi:hypothetical protein
MPKLTTTTDVTVTVAPKLTPALKTKILKKLRIFEEHARNIKIATQAQDKLRAEVLDFIIEGEMFDALMDEGIKVDEFPLKYVSPEKNTFDKDLFVQLGGNLKTFNDAHRKKPTKSYFKITVPGEKDEE